VAVRLADEAEYYSECGLGLEDQEIVKDDVGAGLIEGAGQHAHFTVGQRLVLHACNLHTVHIAAERIPAAIQAQ